MHDPAPPPFLLLFVSPQVTDLGNSKQLKTHSRRPPTVEKLMEVVEKATQNFVTVGEQIASENSEFQVWRHSSSCPLTCVA